MAVEIRDYQPSDEERVVELSLLAWAPVFASMAAQLGPELDRLLHSDDWRAHQARAVRETIGSTAMTVWVAEVEGRVAGFVAATVLDEKIALGEIEMLAVDPSAQSGGIGSALTEHATAWLKDIGMVVATIGTGGDAGHAPARRTYERANYTLFPMARYFKAL